MIIRCDGCGREISKEAAISIEVDEQGLYFCSESCRERGANLESLEPTGAGDHEGPRGFVVTEDD